MFGFLSQCAPTDTVAERLKKAVELDGLGVLDSGIAIRLANALRLLDDADELTLFDMLRKIQRLQCIQDGVGKLRARFLIIHRD